jgi:subtilase family serine protease
VPALAGGASDSGTTDVLIPPGTAAGAYYVIAKADGFEAIPETSETNNTKAKSIAIGPDLVVSGVTGPTLGGAGQVITVGDKTVNNGAGSALASTTKFYLSTNSTWDAADVEIGSRDVPALAAGAADAGNADVQIPATTAAGVYYIIAKADAPGVVGETSESNNTRYKTITIGPDLVIYSITAPASAARGATIQVYDTTRNSGGGGTGDASQTLLALSTNTTYDPGVDIPLYTRGVPQLPQLTSSVGTSTTFTIPAGMTPGTYYLVGVADLNNTVAEGTKETNNTKYKAITIN